MSRTPALSVRLRRASDRTIMNPVAEQLTGWKVEEAVGRALEEVFVIVNEDTGAPVVSPLRTVL